nr:LOW QUALITY PROTEIN: ATP-citrate synthase-like [Leptinotarsa decemlineata]
MSAKAIREATGKNIINKHLGGGTAAVQCRFASVNQDTKFAELVANNPWLKTEKLVVKPDQLIKRRGAFQVLLGGVVSAKKEMISTFIFNLYKLYTELYFTYLEINPLVVTDKEIFILDLAAKLDATADFICRPMWGEIDYPPPFGRDALPEEAYIADLDSKSGASLKLTILNKSGRIWTMVAGGGASVIYSDTICDLGGAKELANYGEYSGAPTEQQTYEYAKTILSLMTQEKHPQGKVLITGGGIANFTNVSATFRGIITALVQFRERLIEHKVSIFVRRAGPNYQEGLRRMREVGQTLGISLYVFGPETHMTAICGMALGTRPIPQENNVETATANFALPSGEKEPNKQRLSSNKDVPKPSVAFSVNAKENVPNLVQILTSPTKSQVIIHRIIGAMFTKSTKAIIWGMQNRAIQSMLDFDFVCTRNEPSVVAIIYPFTGDHKQKFYWGHKEILIPVYKHMKDAMNKHPDADVLVNFASLRSAYSSTVETMQFPQIRTIAIIAEGIPENYTRKLIKLANEKKVSIIGPATVGGVKPGCFKIGNTGGMMDNILHSKLYRPGSVAYVSRSGGMSNELNNIMSKATDGVYEGVAIGGDRYPGTTFMDHIMRYQADDNVKMIVLLGEVGGTEEYEVCRALQNKQITKPLVAWCIGTCAGMFTAEVQFGHAGSCANTNQETATAKNEALRAAGAHVPDSFDYLGDIIQNVYDQLVKQGVIVPAPEVPPPTVPMDYNWARELGLIRKPASFMTSICDERGQELIYAGMPISDVLQKNVGIGGVISLLWFQRCLPPYACKFFEMCLMVTADHGPAVSGAHNTIVCARAGKDLVSSVVSGLLTIGDRFGGALDGAARQFSEAYEKGMQPAEFVNHMRNKGELIMGIGHRVKSINNPDQRVKIVKEFVMSNFPATPHLLYALEVEKITTSKKPNLILNVDGVIAAAFVDMLKNCGSFTSEEAQEYINIGAINSLFVLGRSIGFIGHFMDQKRLKQGLYRHPWDDISYVLPEQYNNDN